MKEQIVTRAGLVKVGSSIEIVNIVDEYASSYLGKRGTVTLIDDIGQLHGTWGGLAIIPEIDTFKIL